MSSSSTIIAEPIGKNVIVVDDVQLTEALIKEQTKLENKRYQEHRAREDEKLQNEKRELKRITDEKLRTEQLLQEERLKNEKLMYAQEEQRRRMRWRAENPYAAAEEDRLHQKQLNEEQAAKEAELRRVIEKDHSDAAVKLRLEDLNRRAWKDTVVTTGAAMVGLGCALIGVSLL